MTDPELVEILQDALDTTWSSEKIMKMIEKPDWDQTLGCNDWRRYIPGFVMDMWFNLSVQARLTAFMMAQNQAEVENHD